MLRPDNQLIVSSYDAEAEEVDSELAGAIPMLRAHRLPPFRDHVVREFGPTPEQLAEKACLAAEQVAAVISARAAGTYVEPAREPDAADVEEEPPRNFIRVHRNGLHVKRPR